MPSIRFPTQERRRRIGVRHHLHPDHPAGSPADAAHDQVGLHSSDPASVFLTAWARVPQVSVPEIERCLYRDHPSLHRVLGIRRTLFAVPTMLVPLLYHGCARRLASAERRRLVGYLEEQGIAERGDNWLNRVAGATVAAIKDLREVPAVELREHVPELRLTLTFGKGKTWGGQVGISTRVLFLLATEGRIVRGRPRGSWISSQYRWAVTESRLRGGIPDRSPLSIGGALAPDLRARNWSRGPTYCRLSTPL